MRKAIIFARVSTARQEKEGLSLDKIQLPKAEQYAKEKGLEIVRTFKIGETGGDYKARKNFEEMVQFAKDNDDVTDIISFRVDRITRNFKDAVVIDKLRVECGKTIHCIDDQLALDENSSSNEITQWDMKVMTAKMYLNRVRDDGITTKNSKLVNGELPWRAPYGYKNFNGNVMTIEPEASIVKEVHARYSTGAYSCRSLAASIRKEYGIKITQGQVDRILSSKFYIGVIVDKKTGKEYPHIYERLVDQDTFNKNQDIIQGHNSHRRRYAGIESPYRGIIDCAECGCSVSPEAKQKKQKNGNVHKYMYYHCTNGKHEHKEKLEYITEKALDEQVSNAISMVDSIPKNEIERVQAKLEAMSKDTNQANEALINKLRKRHNLVKGRIASSYDLLADKRITPEMFDENKKRYDDELSELELQIERINSTNDSFYTKTPYLLDLLKHAPDLFKVADHDEKRQLVGLLLQNLRLNKKELVFQMREPFATILNAKSDLYGWG